MKTFNEMLVAVQNNEIIVRESVSEFKHRLADVKENGIATGFKEAKASGGRYTETLFSNTLASKIQSLAFVLKYVSKPVDAFTYFAAVTELDAKHSGFFAMLTPSVKKFCKDAFGFTGNLTADNVFTLVRAFALVRTGKETACKVTDNKTEIEQQASAINEKLITERAASAAETSEQTDELADSAAAGQNN